MKCDTSIFNEIDDGDGTQHDKGGTLTELAGGKIISEKWLRQLESPYTLQTDLTIERTGKLFVEPGVTVHVAPMVGITVRGVLTALVSVCVFALVVRRSSRARRRKRRQRGRPFVMNRFRIIQDFLLAHQRLVGVFSVGRFLFRARARARATIALR